MELKTEPLHRNERMPFQMGGKPYLWVRVNGQLRAVSALGPDGRLSNDAIARLAGE
jgi:hypothetical protein